MFSDPYAHPVVHIRTLPPQMPTESTDPVLYTLDQGPMEVSYGFDGPSVQYFLRVCDTRLCWRADASREANQVCRALCPDASSGCTGVCGSGGGSYLELHTGPNGMGRRVTLATLAEFWDRYGVPREHQQAMLQGSKKF